MEAAESIPSVSQVYLFLGKCFSYPKKEFYKLMEDERTGEELRVMVEGLPFRVNFKGIPSPSLPQEEFESEYIHSFEEFGSSLPCPLYESAYREEKTSSRPLPKPLYRVMGSAGNRGSGGRRQGSEEADPVLHRLLDEAENVALQLELLNCVAEGLEIDLPSPSAEDLGHPVGKEHALEIVGDQRRSISLKSKWSPLAREPKR